MKFPAGYALGVPRSLGVPGTVDALAIDASAPQRAKGRQGLLLTRYALINLVGLVALTVAWRHGFVDEVVLSDSSGLCIAIGIVFLWAIGTGAWRAWQLSAELDGPASGVEAGPRLAYRMALRRGVDAAVAAESLKSRLARRLSGLAHASGIMVTLGLIGTVVGFVMALGGVDAARVGDVSAIGPMVAQLISGMGVALYTTLVGAVFGIWASVNHRLLAGGAAQLYSAVLETEACSTRTRAPSSATW